MEMYKQNPTYSLEAFKNAIADLIAEDVEGNPIAYGVLKHFAEAVLAIDHTRAKRLKVNALVGLYKACEKKCKELEIPDLHVFTEDEKYAQLLIDKFGFKKIKGVALIKDLR
jgi:hypothetical protein